MITKHQWDYKVTQEEYDKIVQQTGTLLARTGFDTYYHIVIAAVRYLEAQTDKTFHAIFGDITEAREAEQQRLDTETREAAQRRIQELINTLG